MRTVIMPGPTARRTWRHLPNGTVIDGEILAWKDDHVMDFGDLQLRIGRKVVSKKLLTDVPVIVMAYDILEFEGQDVRDRSGLTDSEISQVDAFVRKNTTEKFGPVRVVKPELVFELGVEGLQQSTRHKSGIAVRFPRILRWRTDKGVADADSIEMIQSMLAAHETRAPGA